MGNCPGRSRGGLFENNSGRNLAGVPVALFHALQRFSLKVQLRGEFGRIVQPVLRLGYDVICLLPSLDKFRHDLLIIANNVEQASARSAAAIAS